MNQAFYSKIKEDKKIFLEYILDVESLIQKHFEGHNRWEWEYFTTGRRIETSQEHLKHKSELKDIFISNEFKKILSSWLVSEDITGKERYWLGRYLHKAIRFTIDNDKDVLSLVDEIDNMDDSFGRKTRQDIYDAYSKKSPESIACELLNELQRVAESLAPLIKKLFSRKEILARDAGYDGYVDIALKSDGVNMNTVIDAFDFVDIETLPYWENILKSQKLKNLKSWEFKYTLTNKNETDYVCKNLAECKDLWENIKKNFTPYLDDVYLEYNSHLCFSPILSWPHEICIGGFYGGKDKIDDCRWDIRTIVVLMHEAGHALHYKLLAECDASFRDLYITPVAMEETVTFLAELLLFQKVFLNCIDIDPDKIDSFKEQWQKIRIMELRESLGYSRFDMNAYRLALECPDEMDGIWQDIMLSQTGIDHSNSHWALVGYGFYTEDPVRRYAYNLSALWAKKIAGDSWQGIIDPVSFSPLQFIKIIETLCKNWIASPQIFIYTDS